MSTVVKCQCPSASEGESDIECILVRWVKGVNLAAAAAAVKASIDQMQQCSGSSRPMRVGWNCRSGQWRSSSGLSRSNTANYVKKLSLIKGENLDIAGLNSEGRECFVGLLLQKPSQVYTRLVVNVFFNLSLIVRIYSAFYEHVIIVCKLNSVKSTPPLSTPAISASACITQWHHGADTWLIGRRIHALQAAAAAHAESCKKRAPHSHPSQ